MWKTHCGFGKKGADCLKCHKPRMYMTDDGFYDIVITTVVNYDFMDIATLETADYITIYCPELLELLSPAISGVLLSMMTAKEAVRS